MVVLVVAVLVMDVIVVVVVSVPVAVLLAVNVVAVVVVVVLLALASVVGGCASTDGCAISKTALMLDTKSLTPRFTFFSAGHICALIRYPSRT